MEAVSLKKKDILYVTARLVDVMLNQHTMFIRAGDEWQDKNGMSANDAINVRYRNHVIPEFSAEYTINTNYQTFLGALREKNGFAKDMEYDLAVINKKIRSDNDEMKKINSCAVMRPDIVQGNKDQLISYFTKVFCDFVVCENESSVDPTISDDQDGRLLIFKNGSIFTGNLYIYFERTFGRNAIHYMISDTPFSFFSATSDLGR